MFLLLSLSISAIRSNAKENDIEFVDIHSNKRFSNFRNIFQSSKNNLFSNHNTVSKRAAKDGEPEIPYWQDINAVAINKEKPRTSFVSYDDKKSALSSYDFEKCPNYLNLNGRWKFFYVDYPKDLPEGVTDKDVDTSGWHDINVPGNWEMQGHGVAMYTNVNYDFMPKNPRPPLLPDLVPVGVYNRKFNIPESWLSRNIYLQVGGAKTGMYVYINGEQVGYSEDSKNPADFLINDYVQAGNENVLTLKIYKYSSGSYMDDQDMWRFGGIERDVVLYTQPKMHIKDFNVVSTLDNSYRNGLLRLNVSLMNQDSETKDLTVEYELFDVKNLATAITIETEKVTVEAGNKGKVIFPNKTLNNVKPWSDEQPNLYMLLITIKDRNNNENIIESVPFRIGFRRTEIVTVQFENKDYPVLLFNGKQVLFRGVNIHEHDEHTGHYVTDEIRLKDIKLLKQNNFNAIRFCHYPNARRLFEMCDEYGLHVVNEANIETHGMGYDLSKGGTLANNPDWLIPHLDRTKNMYQRSKNYACVTFFSLGNEAGNGYNFYRTYEYVKFKEVAGQDRPVTYERAEWEWNTDMFVPMYPSAAWFEGMGRSSSDRPIIPCEYSHAMGNSNGNFYRIWKHIYKYPNLQGGFIWDWVDQGILETGKGGRPYWTYGGDYGENAPSDGNFNMNGLVSPNRDPHPCLAEIKYTQQYIAFEASDINSGKFRIQNRFLFTDLANYEIQYSICSNGKVLRSNTLDVNIQPQNFAIVNIDYKDLKSDVATEYFINFSVKAKNALPNIPQGFEVAHDQFRLPIEPSSRKKATETGPDLSTTVSDNIYTISSNKVSFVFNKNSGLVTSYKVEGNEFIKDGFGFQPNFWRSPTDNDYGNGAPKRQQIWKTMSHNFNVKDCQYTQSSDKKSVELKVTYDLVSSRLYEITYKIFSNGVIKVKTSFIGSSGTDSRQDVPRIGLRFRIPQTIHKVEYFGRGPEENYWDRYFASHVSHYKTTAEDMYFPYVRPQENGHHTEVRWFAVEPDVIQSSSKGLLIAAPTNEFIEFNALRNSVEDFDDEDHPELPRQWNNFDDCFHTGLPPQHDEASAVNVLRRQHHIDDITPQDFVEVNIDYKMMGLAGFNSWGDKPLEEFTLPSNKDYKFTFTLIPIDSEDEIEGKLIYEYE